MKWIALITVIIFVSHFSKAQEGLNISWKLKDSIACDSNAVWAVDWIGNLIIQQDGTIDKYDTTGNKLFSQSIKKLGKIAAISPVNAMKIAIFSEDQQAVCILDNTLTLSQECVDLDRYEIQWASCFSPSGQQEKMWVFDELNNRLLLISTNNTNQFQEIKNVTGILYSSRITEIEEFENRLFIREGNGRLFEFDIYGSLVSVYDMNEALDFEFRNGKIVFLEANQEELRLVDETSETRFRLPIQNVRKFKISGAYFYLQTVDKILKYEVSFL
jgi:hypothetical protein